MTIHERARREGIETSYEDAWGRRRRLSRRQIEALLEVLRRERSGEPAAGTAVEPREPPSRPRPLPPVLVLREGEPIDVPVAVPSGAADATLAWRVRDEHGGEHAGSAQVRRLRRWRPTKAAGQQIERRRLTLPLHLASGYHTLRVESPPDVLPACTTQLVIAPARCYLPPALEAGECLWGLAVQLYALRSRRNWGIGDFTDLEDVVVATHALGGDVIGVSPLHALFLTDPERASPYAPSSRRFLNVLYLDVERVADLAECAAARARMAEPEFQRRLAALRAAPLVDYAGVAACKLEILERLYRSFCGTHLGDQEAAPLSARGEAFRRFQREGGRALRRFATFEAASEHVSREGGAHGGADDWPASFRDPEHPDVRAFAGAHSDRIAYFEYLQWLCAIQIEAVRARCEALGLAVGLYLDQAIGVARDGADVWAQREAYVPAASVGAPPDIWNPLGQDWGLPPLHPAVLWDLAYAPFVDVLRASMRDAGALRIDHALALMHLYWIPAGHGPAEGGYIRYPLDDLLGILSLESHRNRCLVIGEDLGTVPDRFRDRLQQNGILSYRLLYFEQDAGGAFRRPEAYPALALASVTTHDLPTLAGYVTARDLLVRSRLRLSPSEELERRAFAERDRDRRALMATLAAEGLWNEEVGDGPPVVDGRLVEAAYVFLAKTPCMVLVVQLEDLLGQLDQPNLPGTVDEHPNWRRKLPSGVADLPANSAVVGVTARIRAARVQARLAP
jgi:(1->4)-alpha-D-glucan 1-alpha-D-glucosylmutase